MTETFQVPEIITTNLFYTLKDFFWCSLNSTRHAKLILVSTCNVQESLSINDSTNYQGNIYGEGELDIHKILS